MCWALGVNNLLMRILDPAFGHPRGFLGQIGGRLMARGNAEQEQWAVDSAQLHPGERVLVIGHGPGVGLALAAAAVGATGRVDGIDPSATMRRMAGEKCAPHIRQGTVEVRNGTADATGSQAGDIDVAISVNNVMLWNLREGFAEIERVLRPGGRLVVTVHRHVLGRDPEELRSAAEATGFDALSLNLRQRRRNSPAVELIAHKTGT